MSLVMVGNNQCESTLSSDDLLRSKLQHNKFEALASESEDRDEPNNIECLNRFDHYVQHG